MFDFVYELLLDFISMLGWYIPILILFSLLGSLVKGGK